jgi:hypothetical protein
MAANFKIYKAPGGVSSVGAETFLRNNPRYAPAAINPNTK